MICQFILRTASSFPCACTIYQVQEFFYCSGVETVDRTHLTVKLRHQVHRAFPVGIDQHAVDHQLFFRSEPLKKALQAADMIDGQLQGGQEMVTNVPRYSQKSIPKTA